MRNTIIEPIGLNLVNDIPNLSERELGNLAEAGYNGKVAGLIRLQALGFSTPPSKMVPAHIFEDFLAGLDESAPYMRPGALLEDLARYPAALPAMVEFLQHAPLPAGLLDDIQTARERWLAAGAPFRRLIVRSSATVEDGDRHSYAGMFASVVANTPEEVEAAVRAVWVSVLAPRALSYYRLSGLTRLPSMALLLQPFIEAERSGVMFTRFPRPEGGEGILIEHVAGDCEQLVSGAVTPDRLWLSLDKVDSVPAKCALAARHVRALAEGAKRLEQVLGCPQDVEWCVWEDDLYMLQTRPITATGAALTPAPEPNNAAVLLRGTGASPGWASGPVHTVFNIEDADRLLPGQVLVTPMTNPDMVTAMRNAVAVVTDVGGMICHAAIVSRELGIPCVVGTEHGSRDLPSGAEVTVDGGHGLVLVGRQSRSAPAAGGNLRWEGLWQDWLHLRPAGALPLLTSAEGLAVAPLDVEECLLDPAPDLLLDEHLQPRDRVDGSLDLSSEDLRAYLEHVAAIAARRGMRVGVLPLIRENTAGALADHARGLPEIFSVTPEADTGAGYHLAQAGDGRCYAVVSKPNSAVCATAAAQGRLVLPLAAVGLAARQPEVESVETEAGKAGVFGRTPGVRVAPMPQAARRQATHALLPALAAAHRDGPPATNAAHEWLDLRPEVVISPMLKSLVAPGMELIPSALGFRDLPPLYVKWIQCRMHFRKDCFFGLWMRVRQATWERAFLADMLTRTRASYLRLEHAAACFPADAAGWRSAENAELAATFVQWWHAFTEFFSLSFLLQAQGDDCVYPWLQSQIDSLGERVSGLPSLADLTAPTTPVLTANYLADLGRLRAALERTACPSVEAALAALAAPAPSSELSEVFAQVRERWFWMRERDPYFPPYDTAEQILGKALKTQPAPLPDYLANTRRARLALAVLANHAPDAAALEQLIYAVGYGHSLVLERENHHVVWLRHSYPFRALCLEWERRLAEAGPWSSGDIFFLEAPEAMALVAALPTPPAVDIRARLRNRRAAYERETRLGDEEQTVADEDDYI